MILKFVLDKVLNTSNETLRQLLHFLSIFKLIQLMLLFGVGIYINKSLILHYYYNAKHEDWKSITTVAPASNDSTSMGIGIIVISLLWIFCLLSCEFPGQKLHNKFFQCLHLVVDVILLIFLIIIGCSYQRHSKLLVDYSTNMKEKCSTTPIGTTASTTSSIMDTTIIKQDERTKLECVKYFTNPTMMHIREIWKHYFEESQTRGRRGGDPEMFQVLYLYQKKFKCCGFGPPLQCNVLMNTQNVTGSSSTSSSRLSSICANATLEYYNPTDTCSKNLVNDVYQEGIIISRGCEYDMPIGNCHMQQVIQGESKGCAAFLEESLNQRMYNLGMILLCMVPFLYAMLLISCCYFWKRKREDVLPDPKIMMNINNEMKWGQTQHSDNNRYSSVRNVSSVSILGEELI